MFLLRGKPTAILAVLIYMVRSYFSKHNMIVSLKSFQYVQVINIFKIKDKDQQIHFVITALMILQI